MQPYLFFDNLKVTNGGKEGTVVLLYHGEKCVMVTKVSDEKMFEPDKVLNVSGFVGFAPVVVSKDAAAAPKVEEKAGASIQPGKPVVKNSKKKKR